MARPLRDPIEKLQTKMFMYYLCTELKLPLYGPDLAEIFDGTRRASSKWKRFVDGEKTPSPGTIKGVLNKVTFEFKSKEVADKLTDFWFSPLWNALTAKKGDGAYWKNFYKNMPVKFHKYVFDKNAQFGNSYKRRYPRTSEVASIEKHCDFDSYAFLIALARDSSQDSLGLYLCKLNVALYRIFFAICQHDPFRTFCLELWQYFHDYVLLKDRRLDAIFHETRWKEPKETVLGILRLDEYYLGLAKQLRLVSTHIQERQFLYYFHVKNPEKMAIEMDAFIQNRSQEYPHLSGLVKKLNTLRKLRDKVNLM